MILPTRGDQEWFQGGLPGAMRGARGFGRGPEGVQGGPPGVTLPTRVLLLPTVELFVSESPWLGIENIKFLSKIKNTFFGNSKVFFTHPRVIKTKTIIIE